MNKDISSDFFALVKEAESIALTTHIHSDGDGMVTCFALQEIMKASGFDSTIVTDGEELDRYAFLMRYTKVQAFHEDMDFGLVIVLDCNSYDRIGNRHTLLDKARKVAVLDHHMIEHNHIPADLQLVDYSYPSVGALIWRSMRETIQKLNPAVRKYVADCVYVSILNDSNNFSNANTNATMFEISAELAQEGIKAHELHMAYLQNHSAKEMLYVGRSLSTIRLFEDGKYLFLHSDKALAEELDVDPSAYMSVTRWVQGISGLSAIAYFREDEPGMWKISLRSLILDMHEVAARHGGGGHRQASGLTLMGSLQEVQEVILHDLKQANSLS
ncbi:MAG: bifunctional oligoribonuclease/PAP phosphatase NrnA [Candidatus Cloacimonetes bacterium]|jgi:phosphoesterase RecJ-like protein|nr:bifunctional oligoribonuclease/PAP phosphatase NrnA [Candidatus Cloacimonadota bacterium]MDD4559498.1 bifunctional oligoribonuclease/PAP phosphatase NrnA [Candidatus Cloacimonadota bacterium]